MAERTLLRKVDDLALTTVVGGRSNWENVAARLSAYALVGLFGLSLLADVRVKDMSQDNYMPLLAYVGMPEISDFLYSADRGGPLEW